MAKIYTKGTWTDESLADDETYQVKDEVGGTIIYPNAEITLASSVITPGTAATAARMNNIENGIDDLDDEIVSMKSVMVMDDFDEVTIASGVAAITQQLISLIPETGTTDDLDSVSDMVAGQSVIFVVADAGTDIITIKHGTGNILCPGESDIELEYGSISGTYDGTNLLMAGGGGGITVEEQDGTPTVSNVTTIKVTNGTLTDDGSGVVSIDTGGGGGSGEVIPTTFNARLTLETGVSVSTSDQADKTTLYLTPHNGTKIALYYSSAWVYYDLSADLSLAVGAYTASSAYDIWCYSNAGTPTLDSTVWADPAVEPTRGTQDGITTKSGDATRRYVGSIYIDSGQKCQYTVLKRFVWNYYNIVNAPLVVKSSAAHTYNATTHRPINNDTSFKVEFIVGIKKPITFNLAGVCKAGAAGSNCYVGISTDSPTYVINQSYGAASNYNANYLTGYTGGTDYLVAGYHYVYGIESGDASNAASFTGVALTGVFA
jgi:hypothetical protein